MATSRTPSMPCAGSITRPPLNNTSYCMFGTPRWLCMNLSHYKSTDPDMDRGDRQKCLKACGNTFPPHDQTTILLLEPGKRPLGLEPRHDFFDRSPARFLGL